MAVQNNLTKFQDSVTVVTANLLNKIFGGLFGSSEGSALDVADPLVAGHVHDGQHLDGHAQKVNLVTHVAGKLTHSNLADNAVRNVNVARFTSQSQAIPEYVIDGPTTYYKLDLSAIRETMSSSGNVFIFRPGTAPNADNVYNDFSDLYIAFIDRQGYKFIQFDDSSGPISIPTGTYDFSDTVWTGTPSQNNFDLTTITIPSGVSFTNIPDVIMGRLELDITSTSDTISIITTDKFLTLDSSNIKCSGTKAFARVVSGTSPVFTLFLTGMAIIQNTGAAPFKFVGAAAASGDMNVYGFDCGYLGDNTIEDVTTGAPNVALNLYYCSPASSLSETHASSPTIIKTLLANADKVYYDNTIILSLAAMDVQGAIDEMRTTLAVKSDTTLTIVTGAIVKTQTAHKIDTEAAAATDDLDTITGGVTGEFLVISLANATHNVVIKHNVGNILCPGAQDLTLDVTSDHLLLYFGGTSWIVIAYRLGILPDIADYVSFYDTSSITKKVRFDASLITAGNTRSLVMADNNVNLSTEVMDILNFSFADDPINTIVTSLKAPSGCRLSHAYARATGIPTGGTIAISRDVDGILTNQLTTATVNASTVSPADTQVDVGTLTATAINRDFSSTAWVTVTVANLNLPVATDSLYIAFVFIRSPA